MSQYFHMVISCRGVLKQPDKQIHGIVTDDNGRELNATEIKEMAIDHLRRGYDVFPLCSNHDEKGHCKGHEQEGGE